MGEDTWEGGVGVEVKWSMLKETVLEEREEAYETRKNMEGKRRKGSEW